MVLATPPFLLFVQVRAARGVHCVWEFADVTAMTAALISIL